MRIPYRFIAASSILVLLLVVLGAATLRSQESFQATHMAHLSPEEETDLVLDDGVGLAIIRVDATARTIDYRITVTAMASITGAAIHGGDYGVDGPAVLSIPLSTTRLTASGSFANVRSSFIDSVLGGYAYINVRSTNYPSGQIRGQITLIPNAMALQLSPRQVTDSVASDTADGSAVMYVDPATHRAIYSLEWSHLTGSATSAEFRNAAPGSNGPVVHTMTISQPGGNGSAGIWNMTAEQFAALLNGDIYATVATSRYPNGEVRGQISPVDFFTAAIASSNVVPPVTGAAEGTGIIGVMRLGAAGGFVEGDAILEQTSGPITSAGINRGTIGQNGAPIFSLDEGFTNPEWSAFNAISVDDMQAMRDRGAYMIFNTAAHSSGEARGQLIPALAVLPLVTSAVPVVTGPNMKGRLDVAYDGPADRVRVRLAEIPVGDAIVTVYSTAARVVASTAVNSNVASIDASALAAGEYFVQLTIDRHTVGSGRVTIVR